MIYLNYLEYWFSLINNVQYIPLFRGCSMNNTQASATIFGFQFQINAGEYITLMLGSPSAYSNKIIYSGSRLSVSVIRYLDWVDL